MFPQTVHGEPGQQGEELGRPLTNQRCRPFVPKSNQRDNHPRIICKPQGAPQFHQGQIAETSVTFGTRSKDARSEIADSSTGATYARPEITIPCTVPNDTNSTEASNPLPFGIISPVNSDNLDKLLSVHPDRDFVQYVNNGFRNGFDLFYCGSATSTSPKNLRLSETHAKEVTDAIAKELKRGHTSGPFNSPPFSVTHCSPLGAVEKSDSSVRLILDLSQPRGSSVNENIMDEYCSVKYTSFDEAVRMVKKQGVGAYMTKVDIRHAFRLCPVRVSDWPLLCYVWKGKYYVDTRLPFGGRSSPAIFNTFADALNWILQHHGQIDFIVHYLDDFLICAPEKDTCTSWLCHFQDTMDFLGIPVAHDKTVPPTPVLVFLGIEIDAVAQVIRLPKVKLDELLSELDKWSFKKKCTKRELLSLIGVLSFTAKVVKAGRTFLRRLIDLSTVVSSLGHHISLNQSARADISWWMEFLPIWNGVELFQDDLITSFDLSLYTDASDIGMGGVLGRGWFSVKWPNRFSSKFRSTNFQELFAIFTAVTIWANELSNKQIKIFCDNETIVTVMNSGTCTSSSIMNVVRRMFYVCAKHNISLCAEHVRGIDNGMADALSRLQGERFARLHPSASKTPTPIPHSIWTL